MRTILSSYNNFGIFRLNNQRHENNITQEDGVKQDIKSSLASLGSAAINFVASNKELIFSLALSMLIEQAEASCYYICPPGATSIKQCTLKCF